ncbi:MAG: CpsB/CapC family capsule biosynthesis tyrosine phosphatase [Lysobacteraceae bacterium]
MIDLHCHILPGIDDGAPDLEEALAMARVAVADGIRVTACTPHIYPGLYENDAAGIRRAMAEFRRELDREGIPLQLVEGADVHLCPDLLDGLRGGRIPTLARSRYFLFEPPHHVAPPRLENVVFDLVAAGYVPVLTHPERLTWIDTHYSVFAKLVHGGAWMQLTAGAITGRFGRRPRYWAERMLDENLVHIIATDAHRADKRPPLLAEAREAVAPRVGAGAADDMVNRRPQAILQNAGPETVALPERERHTSRPSLWRRFWGAR